MMKFAVGLTTGIPACNSGSIVSSGHHQLTWSRTCLRRGLFVFFPEALFDEVVVGWLHAVSDVFDHLWVATGVDAGFSRIDTELFQIVFNQQVDSTLGASPVGVSFVVGT